MEKEGIEIEISAHVRTNQLELACQKLGAQGYLLEVAIPGFLIFSKSIKNET